MKDRGKEVDTNHADYCYSSDNLVCKKHPSSSQVGICAYCLKERLKKLICSDCGEQRLSPCSCGEVSSSYTSNSSNTIEVGSVGRVSFLIENERIETPFSNSKLKIEEKIEKIIHLKRSSSTHVEIKRNNAFRRFRMLFMKKREKNYDERNDDHLGVSRSRSLCSFRGGGGWLWSDDGVDSMMSVSAARSSSVYGGLLTDSGKKSGFSETEARKSGVDFEKKNDILESENGFKDPIKMVYKLKESDFNTKDDSGFIDLNLDLSSKSKTECSVSDLDSVFNKSTTLRGVNHVRHDHDCGRSFRCLGGEDGILSNRGSCRITVNDPGIKKSRKSLKVWRWIFKHHPNPSFGGSAKKKDVRF